MKHIKGYVLEEQDDELSR
ncbi:hypothetical protein [Escherichia albertii]